MLRKARASRLNQLQDLHAYCSLCLWRRRTLKIGTFTSTCFPNKKFKASFFNFNLCAQVFMNQNNWCEHTCSIKVVFQHKLVKAQITLNKHKSWNKHYSNTYMRGTYGACRMRYCYQSINYQYLIQEKQVTLTATPCIGTSRCDWLFPMHYWRGQGKGHQFPVEVLTKVLFPLFQINLSPPSLLFSLSLSLSLSFCFPLLFSVSLSLAVSLCLSLSLSLFLCSSLFSVSLSMPLSLSLSLSLFIFEKKNIYLSVHLSLLFPRSKLGHSQLLISTIS